MIRLSDMGLTETAKIDKYIGNDQYNAYWIIITETGDVGSGKNRRHEEQSDVRQQVFKRPQAGPTARKSTLPRLQTKTSILYSLVSSRVFLQSIMTSIMHYLHIGNNASSPKEGTVPANDTPVRALPASWYTSQELYELERRAIFSKRWLFITHSSRLKEPGDWFRYEMAGFDFIIIRDRQGNINAFHNVCRHRAYPVIDKQGQGNAKIIACRYHGWSYGLNGKLAKAPGYQELDGFNKEQNGLFRIHVKIDVSGFIWVNMDAKDIPEVSWEEHFRDVDKQERYKHYNFDDYDLDHTYELEGDYNWKILADNFNECYHCPTTHADVPEFLNLDSFGSDVKDGHIQHHCAYTPEQKAKGLYTASTYYFPVSAMVVSYVLHVCD